MSVARCGEIIDSFRSHVMHVSSFSEVYNVFQHGDDEDELHSCGSLHLFVLAKHLDLLPEKQ